jgi:hypothetical protein
LLGKVRQGYIFPGPRKWWTRLTIEHLRPRQRTRHIVAACAFCNWTRQHGRLTDEQVRRKAVRFWTRMLGDKPLPWLRTRVRSTRGS